MPAVALAQDDVTVAAGRAFARTAPDGRIDGSNARGVYDDDVRLLRRVEAHRAGNADAVAGHVAVAPGGCEVTFDLPAIEPGTGVLLVVEVDGTDLLTIRQLHRDGKPDAAAEARARPEAQRSQARVRLDASCDGAVLAHRDGVALAQDPVAADGTARTASWRWMVPADQPAAVDVAVRLRASWSTGPESEPGELRGRAQLEGPWLHARGRWLADRPQVEGVEALEQVASASLEDLAMLRIDGPDGAVLAAGIPWFLTTFGRDALLASWMALPVDPDLAVATLRHLARTQAGSDDPSIDAEPGKVLHEERRGIAASRWHPAYFGSVDATPLFVMLLAETCRWTGDLQLARDLEDEARAAVGWVLDRVDEDELGLLGYERRAQRGLDVQSWKDSPDSQRDHAGRVAVGRIRPLEAQAYAVAALRAGSRLATAAWGDEVRASEWGASARLLERRMVDRCLVELPASQLFRQGDPRRGGFLAQGVDALGLPLDALCSNIGHVLWADAVADPSLRSRIVEQLTHPALDSGWGIRTMSDLDDGFDAGSFHCGSVWPHDTAICIAGIARYDRERAARLGQNLVEAAHGSGGRLPEHFSGAAREEGDSRPAALSSACSPQAWAAAAPFLVLRALLGLEPDAAGATLTSVVGEAPAWLVGARWRGLHALGQRWDVEVRPDGSIDVVERAGA